MTWLLWKQTIRNGDPFGKSSHRKMIATILNIVKAVSPNFSDEKMPLLQRYARGVAVTIDDVEKIRGGSSEVFCSNKILVNDMTVSFTSSAYELVKKAMDYAIEHPVGFQINNRVGLSRLAAKTIRESYPKAPFNNLIEVSGI